MTRQEFKAGLKFKVIDNERQMFDHWKYFYINGSIMAIDHWSNTILHAFVLAIDSKHVYVRFFLIGQEVKQKIPLKSLQTI
jgi:hypothetical protein